MLKIRLQRGGRRNEPTFRVVVTEHTRGAKSQKHVDRVGFYNPKTKEQSIDKDRVLHWLSVGAQASGTVHNMLVKAGIIKADTVNVLPKKTPIATEKAEEEGASHGDEAPATEDGAEVAGDDTATDTDDTPEESASNEAPSEAPVNDTASDEAPASEEEKEE